MEIQKQKIQQIRGLLDEVNLDVWMIAVRETPVLADPILSLVVGYDVTWQSFFIFTRSGKAIALVGNLDQEDFVRSGCFTDVITYTEGVSRPLREVTTRLDPQTIGINFSKSNSTADGITYGMYLNIRDYLEGTPYAERLVSAEEICSKVRSRKTSTEIDRISKAADMTLQAWDDALGRFRVGMTEKEIGKIIDGSIARTGGTMSFDTIVNAGDKTKPGHGHPTDAIVEPGDLLHVDFGIRYNDYCSDLQRLVYFKRPAETEPPDELKKAFDLVSRIITETGKITRPGVAGVKVDSLARTMLKDEGYPEYAHALGHQLGRSVHDGGALIGPKWERYGPTPTIPLELNNVFTLELEIMLPGIGCVGLEEDVVITKNGARYLCDRQQELIVV